MFLSLYPSVPSIFPYLLTYKPSSFLKTVSYYVCYKLSAFSVVVAFVTILIYYVTI